jgi:superfamily II DNA or RNA helicase
VEKTQLDLKSLKLKVTYRSIDEDIVNTFYILCLSNSILYRRAVGYFTSTALSEAARGIYYLVKNDGRIEIVASPKLTEEDIKAIEAGYESRKIVMKALEQGLRENLTEPDTVLVQNLTWMIANQKMDIKIAVPKSRKNEGIYHEKIGLFYDPKGNVVAFSGSLNETSSGLVSNYESIDVSVSWEEGAREKERVRNHIEHFELLWKGGSPGLEVIDFPEAIKRVLIEKYTPKKPEIITNVKNIKKDEFPKRIPYEFQEKAINAWLSASYKGILAMATGSGKTYTSLKALEKCPELKLALIIVPSSNLVYQWENEIRREYGENSIIRTAHSGEKDWRGKIDRMIDWLKIHDSSSKRAFVVATIHTARSDIFRETLKRIPSKYIGIVVDEVHHSGAPIFKRIFDIEAQYRLGLSATPDREWDDEGNQAIFDFFGKVVFEYSISDAIRDGFLSKYYYYPHIVPLNFEERTNFGEVSRDIAATTSQIRGQYLRTREMTTPQLLQYLENNAPELSVKLRALFLKRVEIVKKAENKYEALRKIIRNYPVKRCLVYCNDLKHLEENVKVIYQEGFEPIEFSSRIKPETRKKILQAFEEGGNKNTFLVAVKCLDEGIDIPACDSAILVSCSRSVREFVQRRGRLLRKHPTKDFSTIHDIVILPFANKEEAYPLTLSEFGFIKEELRRVEILSGNAENSKDFNVDNQIQLYRRYVLG